jgi:peptide-methionine (R)-S-oxide reductase
MKNAFMIAFAAALTACNTPQSTRRASGENNNTPAATPVSLPVGPTIVPATFDNTGALIRLQKSQEEWKKELSDTEYYVLRSEGTERAFTGDLWNHHGKGTYTCRGCALPLFHSDTKFESGTGWPSYFQPIDKRYVTENEDRAYGMLRVEVECARCGGHLGHVFDDGPQPTGLRYCINSVSLDFVAD